MVLVLFCQVLGLACFEVYSVDLVAALFDGLRNGKGHIALADDIVLEGVVVPDELFRDSVGLGPCVVNLLHDDEVEVIGVRDSSATQVD